MKIRLLAVELLFLLIHFYDPAWAHFDPDNYRGSVQQFRQRSMHRFSPKINTLKIKKPFQINRTAHSLWSHLGSNQGLSDYESDTLTN